jgi:hypothetical protein
MFAEDDANQPQDEDEVDFTEEEDEDNINVPEYTDEPAPDAPVHLCRQCSLSPTASAAASARLGRKSAQPSSTARGAKGHPL